MDQARKSFKLAKLKPWSIEQGLPYTSTREAGLRGEFPIFRFGRALYLRQCDGERWIETRKERVEAAR